MKILSFRTFVHAVVWATLLGALTATAQDLKDVKARGVLRHLGIRYANFVTGSGDGLDVEMIQMFASHLGVRYEFVETNWNDAFGDLTGLHAGTGGTRTSRPIRGDVIANGMTVLPSRAKLLDYSAPTFPSAVWLVARADSPVAPIRASGNLRTDIRATKERMVGSSTLVMESTCLDPALYDLTGRKLDLRYYTRSTNLNEMVPAIMNRDAEMALLDVPDALIALEKWPGQIKVIGPISEKQAMAAGFRKSSPELRGAFNAFLAGIQQDGRYMKLVKKYYPTAARDFPEFFGRHAARSAPL
jgi:ABC-type amino acid transport substrate-binding protein